MMKMTAVMVMFAVASLVLASLATFGGIEKSTTSPLLPGQFPLALNLPQPTSLQTLSPTNTLYGLRTPGGPLTHSAILVPGKNYQSEPYACLIAVPEPTHDDCCVGSKPGIDPQMQISRPAIQFIPRATP